MIGLNGQQTVLQICESECGGKQSQSVSSKSLLRKLEQQGRRCALTGVPLTPQTVSLDHVVPLTEGGGNDISNVQLVHEVVNIMKGTMGHDEFVKWCRLVAEYHQRGDETCT